jgi:hypothetical protein
MKRSAAVVMGTAAALAAAVLAVAAQAGPPWGPEAPPFNIEVVLRDVEGPGGFGHVKFRQPNDAQAIVRLGVWVRDLAPNHPYYLERATDGTVNDECVGTNWLKLGQGPVAEAFTTDDRGFARASLFRDLSAVGVGARFDIHFRVTDAATSAVVLESACYQFTVTA